MEDWRKVKRAVFARHSNPWSAWTTWASAPLMLVPVWRRSWRDAALVGVWMALYPVVFGKPDHERAWATRAVLGEKQWIAERPLDIATAVEVAATAAGLVAMVAARRRCDAGRGSHGVGDGAADGVLGADGSLLRPQRWCALKVLAMTLSTAGCPVGRPELRLEVRPPCGERTARGTAGMLSELSALD